MDYALVRESATTIEGVCDFSHACHAPAGKETRSLCVSLAVYGQRAVRVLELVKLQGDNLW